MQILDDEKLQVEPDTDICTTEQITNLLSRCSGNNDDCIYNAHTYCFHPDHRKFLMF
jgi:hypothetical protein